MATSETRDRRARLAAQEVLNAIDFVEVSRDETVLRVHFLCEKPTAAVLKNAITGAAITGGRTIPTVAVEPSSAWSWTTVSDRPVLELRVEAPGDFSTYTLALTTNAAVLDRFFDRVAFSFKANCPSTLDCADAAPACPAPENDPPPIDYLAKDFESFRRALLEFSSLRYPNWQERSEADFGVMFLEALAAVADDLSYQQDRIAAEGWLETATQRRSLLRLARLVDYEPGVMLAARTTLQFQVTTAGVIPTGLAVSALDPEGALVEFETGKGLEDTGTYAVEPAWNELTPYWFDDEQRCLPAGATTLSILRPSVALRKGDRLLLEVSPESPADPPLRTLVQLSKDPTDDVDPLFGAAGGTLLSTLEWLTADAPPFALDLGRAILRGNLVPATEGRRSRDRFVIATDGSPFPTPPRAVVRTGANRSLQFLHTLERGRVAWLEHPAPEGAAPEMIVSEVTTGRWNFRSHMLESDPFEQAFTLDPVRYRKVDAGLGASEYDGDAGDTIRFGDGERGAIPAEGAAFEVLYRVGGGARGNVAADTLTRVALAARAAHGIVAVSNPLAATGGRDEEPAEQIRESAPEAFRAKQFRAVLPSDYDESIVRELSWVQRAGTRFRHTGSWLSVFSSVDPYDTESLSPEHALGLCDLLNRYRMAGYETYGVAPRYASLDVSVTVCARPDAFRGDVERAARSALLSFFSPERFTFGMPLERSALEVAVQGVPGIDGVTDVRYRRRGHTAGDVPMLDTVEVADDEIVRVDNDPSRPDAGSLRITIGGGK